MKKVFLLGCILIFVFCAPKKMQVKTEGLEEVVVYGEEEEGKGTVVTEPVLPTPTEETAAAPSAGETTIPQEEVAAAPSEEVVAPPVEETEAPPTVESKAAPPAEETVTLPPLEEEEIPAPPVEEEEVVTAPPTVPTPPPVPAPAKPAKILGFRVQLFASSTEKNAERVADDARNSFKENVYVEHVAPYYKVRVGDCLTREEAQVLKNKAISLGYRGAFVVETTISP